MNVIAHAWEEPDSIPIISRENLPASGPAMGSYEIPPEVVRGRSKKLRARVLETPGWKMVVGDSAVVRGDLTRENLKEIVVLTSELQVMLRHALGGGNRRDFKISVRVFSQEREFRRAAALAGAPRAESYYSPINAEVVMHFDGYPTRAAFLRTFSHEFAHAYMDRVFGKTRPIWLAEGMAEWFSNVQWRGDILVPGGPNLSSLRSLSMNRENLSMKRLLGVSYEEMIGINFQSYYAQSWSVVDFVMNRMPYRSLTRLIEGDMETGELLDREPEWREHVNLMLQAVRMFS